MGPSIISLNNITNNENKCDFYNSCKLSNNNRLNELFALFLISMLSVLIAITFASMYFPSHFALAQPLSSSTDKVNIQQWTDRTNSLRIQFNYLPQNPIVDSITKMNFVVQNLTTGTNMKNLLARVVVTNGQRFFKFDNITIPNGNFTVQYLFPDTGTYQVIARVDDFSSNIKNFSTLSSFQVPVSIQLAGADNNFITISVVSVIIAAGILLYFLFVSRRMKQNKKESKYIPK